MTESPNRIAETNAVMASRAPSWLAAVARRTSRRAYDGTQVDSARLDLLEDVCRRFRPYADARSVLVRDPVVDVFTGVLGSYGKVSNPPHVLVFIGDKNARFSDQHVGLTGEAPVLEATALGLDTVWIGGFFSAKRVATLVDLAPGERVFAVSPVGFAVPNSGLTERAMRGMAGSHKRRTVEEIARGIGPSWPEWAVAAVETARLAPSAINRQPWRFRMDGSDLVVSRDSAAETPKVTKRLDCGIAMLHAQLGALAEGQPGAWIDVDSGLDAARYHPVSA